MLGCEVLERLGDGEWSTINRLADRLDVDSRGVRAALLQATEQGLVEADRRFEAWRLTEYGRARIIGD